MLARLDGFPPQAESPHLRDGEHLDLLGDGLTAGATHLERQQDVRISPVELRHGPFDFDFARHVVGRSAVMTE